MVGTAGFELATPCTPCKCATRLRYAPTEPRSIAEIQSVRDASDGEQLGADLLERPMGSATGSELEAPCASKDVVHSGRRSDGCPLHQFSRQSGRQVACGSASSRKVSRRPVFARA